jgi:hypothetical protein
MDQQARCPQWWRVFEVRGKTGVYDVWCDVARDTWRCRCLGLMFAGRGGSCKHIRRVLRNGCFGTGRNNLGAVGVTVTGKTNPVPRATKRTRRHCACGEMMLAPDTRTRDDAGHQIVRVQFSDGGPEYAYAWGGQRPLTVGDAVDVNRPSEQWAVPRVQQLTVVALGSDWAGPLTVIRRPAGTAWR